MINHIKYLFFMANFKATNPGESYEFLHSGNLKFSKILELKKE